MRKNETHSLLIFVSQYFAVQHNLIERMILYHCLVVLQQSSVPVCVMKLLYITQSVGICTASLVTELLPNKYTEMQTHEGFHGTRKRNQFPRMQSVGTL